MRKCSIIVLPVVLAVACGGDDDSGGGAVDAALGPDVAVLDGGVPDAHDLDGNGGATCPEGWTEIGGGCFTLVTEPAPWAGARVDCQTRSAELARVDDPAELGGVAALLSESAWLGGYDAIAEGTFLWTDGSAVAAELPWAEGQPDDGGKAGEDCVATSTSGELSDDDCQVFMPYVCRLTD